MKSITNVWLSPRFRFLDKQMRYTTFREPSRTKEYKFNTLNLCYVYWTVHHCDS